MTLKELKSKLRACLDQVQENEKQLFSGERIMTDKFILNNKKECDKNLANIQKNCGELYETYKTTSKNMAEASSSFKKMSDNLK